jgi:hypothetical protein
MNKRLPVGPTIRSAYVFTFGEIGTVIGLIWIPTLINAVGSFFIFGAYDGAMQQADGIPMMGGPYVGLMFLYFLVAFLLVAMMAVAIAKQVLGQRSGTPLAYFSLGSAEFRVFGGIFCLYLLFVLFVFVFAAVLVIAAISGAAIAKQNAGALPLVGALVGVLATVGFCVMIYIFVRLSFLFVPAAVTDGEFGLARSWELTKGNFWRILAVGLAVILPVLLLQGASEYFILGPDYFNSFAHAMRDPANATQFSLEQSRIMQPKIPVLLGLGLILAPVTQGLLFSTPAFAYRALAGRALPADQ